MTEDRRIAIICWNKDTTWSKKIVEHLYGQHVVFYYKPGVEEFTPPNCDSAFFPEEIDTPAKAKNYVIQREKELSEKFSFQWLHVIEDTVEVLKDPLPMMDDVEKMLDALDLNSWLGTVTDGCNLVYTKYNPRLRVKIDRPDYKEKLGVDELVFCSHSNTQWMVFNVKKGDAEELHFREDFKIAMFWIIEYLARRRNTHPESLYFMNQYVTVSSELGTFVNREVNESDKEIESPEAMKQEDDLFKTLKVNYAPDNNIDLVLERTYKKLQSKFGLK